MKMSLPWREKRLFVALGEHSVALACMVNGWREWHTQAQQVLPLQEEISAPALVTMLRSFMSAQGLGAGCRVHWFLPPDILAVAFVPQDLATVDTQWLPYQAPMVALGAIAGGRQFTTALWIHRNWQDLFRGVTEQVGGQLLYFHPRALYVHTLLQHKAHSNAENALQILKEGRDWHLFHRRHGLVRSLTQAQTLTPVQAETRMGLEVQQVLTVLDAPATGVLNAQQQLQASAVQDVTLALSRITGPVPREWRLSSAQLHACGLLMGQLTSWVEHRLQMVTGGLMLVFALGAAVAWQHDQTLQQEQREMAAQLKSLLPEVEKVQQLKTETSQQSQILSVHHAVSEKSYDWHVLAHVLAQVPKGAAVQAVFLDHEALRVELLYPSAKGILSSWSIPEAIHPALTEVPDTRTTEDKSVRVRYATHFKRVSDPATPPAPKREP
jgi:hypothetical protein